MGKQLSLYLDEHEVKRLAEIAERECRRPADQARWILLKALAEMQNDTQSQSAPNNQELAFSQ